jgi:hypothetical protein
MEGLQDVYSPMVVKKAVGIDGTSPAVPTLRDLNKPFANWTDLAFQKPLLHAAIA